MTGELPAGQTSTWSRVWKLFWNEQEGRLRAFCRVLLQLVTAAIITIVLEIGFSVLLPEKTMFSVFSKQNLISLGFVGSVWLAARFLDHRPFTDFGLRFNKSWWVDAGFGLVLGALMEVSQFLVQWANGWITVTDTFYTTDSHLPFAVILVFSLVTFLGVGISEELVSRGYQLRNMAEGLNFPFVGPRVALLLALLLSSSVFGLLHLVMHSNADAGLLDNVLSILPQTLDGFMLGIAYLLTGQLAVPIGIHTAVNFFGTSIFGSGESETHFPSFFTVEPTEAGQKVFAPILPNVLFEGLLWVPVVLLIVLWVSRRHGRIVLHTFLSYPSQR